MVFAIRSMKGPTKEPTSLGATRFKGVPMLVGAAAVASHRWDVYPTFSADALLTFGGVIASISSTMLGPMLAALAVLASINHTHLVKMMRERPLSRSSPDDGDRLHFFHGVRRRWIPSAVRDARMSMDAARRRGAACWRCNRAARCWTQDVAGPCESARVTLRGRHASDGSHALPLKGAEITQHPL